MIWDESKTNVPQSLTSIKTVLAKIHPELLLIRTYKFRPYQNHEQSKKLDNNLAVRIHRYDVCGLVLDRDHNSAIDIKKKRLEIIDTRLPQELRKCTPVEIPEESLKQENAVVTT